MKSSNDVCVIIAAAGKGERAALGYNKTLWRDGGCSIVRKTAEKFGFVKKIIVACAPGEKEVVSAEFKDMPNVVITEGGNSRSETVRRALLLCDCKITLVHDGARPFVSKKLIENVIENAAVYGCAVPCTPAEVALKQKEGDKVKTLDRKGVLFVQTPQGFDTAQLKKAYECVPGDYADDSEVWERSGRKIHIVDGETCNKKLTYADDFLPSDNLRIGTGYDVHELTPGRELILGGVKIPFEKGLSGHSDADVLVHAVMDAVLSAAGLPDIGVLFPVNDSSLDGISSMMLLDRVREKTADYEILNLSAVVMAEKPRLAEVIPVMRAKIADKLKIGFDAVNISATTTEKLGIVGEGRGMAASATVLMRKKSQ